MNIFKNILNFLKSLNIFDDSENLPPNMPTLNIIIPKPAGIKRALCCGINNYGGRNNLRGCINDMNDWASLLKDVYKFDQVTTLSDLNCTRENFINVMKELINKSVVNDIVVATYSGHGTTVVDKNGDEEDGKDEALYLANGPLIDDEIKAIMDAIKDGVKVTFISDSCFSGTNTRALNDDTYKVARYMPFEDEFKVLSLKTNSRVFRTVGKTEEEMKEILISGSKNTEVSYDAEFGGKNYGAMSYYATRILRENPIITYADFYNKLREKLPNSSYPQSPQLEGSQMSKAQLMFG